MCTRPTQEAHQVLYGNGDRGLAHIVVTPTMTVHVGEFRSQWYVVCTGISNDNEYQEEIRDEQWE